MARITMEFEGLTIPDMTNESSQTLGGVILEDTPTDYFTEYMAAAKKTLNKNAAENKFFAKVYKSMKESMQINENP